jgi:hypothetical protein
MSSMGDTAINQTPPDSGVQTLAPRTPAPTPTGMDRGQVVVHCVVAFCLLVSELAVLFRPNLTASQEKFAYVTMVALLLTSGIIKLAEIVSLRSPNAGRFVGPGAQMVLAAMAAMAAVHVF